MFNRFRRPLTVTREQPGQYVDGIWQPGTSETLTARCSVQPIGVNDMDLLPEGRRDRQAFALYGKTELRMADDNAETNADRVEIDGAMFEVVHVELWKNGIINHCRALVTKEAEQ